MNPKPAGAEDLHYVGPMLIQDAIRAHVKLGQDRYPLITRRSHSVRQTCNYWPVTHKLVRTAGGGARRDLVSVDAEILLDQVARRTVEYVGVHVHNHHFARPRRRGVNLHVTLNDDHPDLTARRDSRVGRLSCVCHPRAVGHEAGSRRESAGLSRSESSTRSWID